MTVDTGTITTAAPRAFNREIYHDHPENVFYGTDDGSQDGSFAEFAEIKHHYESVSVDRQKNIHMISVVGGLYGLNLIPLWRPKRITIFDINPMALTYFQTIRRVFTTSRDPSHFLERLTAGDYEVAQLYELRRIGGYRRAHDLPGGDTEKAWRALFKEAEVRALLVLAVIRRPRPYWLGILLWCLRHRLREILRRLD